MPEPREVEAALLLADLSGYTALTEAHGDLHGAKVVARYTKLAAEAVRPGTRVVERVGDELLFVADAVAPALATAVALREAVEREPLFPWVRAGLHAGRVLEQEGRYFGAALNLTARVAGHARAGQILCTEPVAAAGAPPGLSFQSLGRIRFKNIAEPVPILELVVLSADVGATAIDPVCRMQVRPEAAPARLPFAGRTWWFCSFDCARAFAARPELYAAEAAPPRD